MHIHIYIYIYSFAYIYVYIYIIYTHTFYFAQMSLLGLMNCNMNNTNCLHFSICACHPCAGPMLIFSESLQF